MKAFFSNVFAWLYAAINTLIVQAGAALIALAAGLACFQHIQYVCDFAGESEVTRWLIPATFDALAVICAMVQKHKGTKFTPRQRMWAHRGMVVGLSASLVGNFLAAALRVLTGANYNLASFGPAEWTHAIVALAISLWPIIPLFIITEVLLDSHARPNQVKPKAQRQSKPATKTPSKAPSAPATGSKLVPPGQIPIVVPARATGALNGHANANI